MAKLMIMALLGSSLFVQAFDANAQNFNYTPTATQSKSNYQRIALIDNYLKKLPSNISRMRMEIDRKYSTGDKNIMRKIKALDNAINMLKMELQSLRGGNRQRRRVTPSPEKSSKSMAEMEAQVDENAEKIGALQASFRQMNNTLLSIEELMKTQKEGNVDK